VVYITHDIGEALTLADRIVVMTARPGRIKTIQQSPFDRDRDAMTLRAHPEFGRLETEIWRLMADEVGHSLGGTQGDT
jgi:NitT/TauT family transport system ATP-binding protein